MRILITNNTLAERAGTEVYVRDLALALLARGHRPVVYSQILGEVAHELEAAAVPVVDDLSRITEPPQIIHGHHHLETMTALSHFPAVPAVFVCHGWAPWQEAPPVHPRIVRYIAVDELCRERIVDEAGVHPDKIEIILNFVDLDLFRPRQRLPDAPGRALLYSNHAGSGRIAEEIERACLKAGVDLDVVGLASGNPTASPQTLLPKYDLVFAKARAALEAMAVGCAVILCDVPGLGPLVDTENFDRLRPLNFGLQALSSPLTADAIGAQLARYDRNEAAAVSARVRSEASLSDTVERLIALYRSCAGSRTLPAQDEGRAAADYIRTLAPRIKENDLFHLRVAEAAEVADHWRRRAEAAAEDLARLESEHEDEQNAAGARIKDLAAENRVLGRSRDQLEKRAAALESESSTLRDQLGRAYGTLTWRVRERVLATRSGRILRRVIGRFR